VVLLFGAKWESNPSKCRCPVGICLPLAGRRRLHNIIDPRILLTARRAVMLKRARTQRRTTQRVVLLFGAKWESNPSKCRCPADICLPPAGRRQLHNIIDFRILLTALRAVMLKHARSPRRTTQRVVLLFGAKWESNPSKCRCPADICLPPAGRRRLHNIIDFRILLTARRMALLILKICLFPRFHRYSPFFP